MSGIGTAHVTRPDFATEPLISSTFGLEILDLPLLNDIVHTLCDTVGMVIKS